MIYDINDKIRDEKGGEYRYTPYAYINQSKIGKKYKADSSSNNDDESHLKIRKERVHRMMIIKIVVVIWISIKKQIILK